ncbi:Fructose-2,6-bisphosphatase [Marasmius tenuissimus]|uniref:Fructose-2,6-bisphosphatase n=1 Tax=Marasmius tenuissimus TaxID=585030 RepID=A0ABR2ZVD8_9AGAR
MKPQSFSSPPSSSNAVGEELARAADALQIMQESGDLAPVVTISDTGSPNIPPALFGAGGPNSMLKKFDVESTMTSRKGSTAPTPPPAIKGIGKKVARIRRQGPTSPSMINEGSLSILTAPNTLQVFNVGQLRRSKARQKAQKLGIKEDHTASFFSHDNKEATQNRDSLAEESLSMLIQWLKDGGNVGIHDATNSTQSRRAKIEARIAKEKGMSLIFLESLCDDPAVIAANVALKVSQGDPDYKDMSREDAKRDFLHRIREYEKVYETITEPHLSYVRILNVGEEVTLSRINGYLSSRIAFYLMNLHIKPRSIYLSRHGESQYNVEGKIGGDSLLSPRGMQYAKALPALVTESVGEQTLTVWTSTLKRTIQTAQYLPYTKLTWKSLDELDAGVCDGMTYEEIEKEFPEDFANRDDDKFNYRYRGGESYRDVVIRLEPVIMELERQGNILIVGHQAILRCLYAYFHHLPQVDLPYIKIPLHTVIKLTPRAYGCDEERFALPIDAVDTHRPKPGTVNKSIPASSSQRKYFVEEEAAKARAKEKVQVHAPVPRKEI